MDKEEEKEMVEMVDMVERVVAQVDGPGPQGAGKVHVVEGPEEEAGTRVAGQMVVLGVALEKYLQQTHPPWLY